MQEIEKEKEHLLQMKIDYEEKLTQFDRNCKQLLQEAEVWDLRSVLQNIFIFLMHFLSDGNMEKTFEN